MLETPEALRCTPTGQVSDLPGVKCVPALTAARSRELAATRGAPSGEELRRRVAALLRLPLSRCRSSDGYMISCCV